MMRRVDQGTVTCDIDSTTSSSGQSPAALTEYVKTVPSALNFLDHKATYVSSRYVLGLSVFRRNEVRRSAFRLRTVCLQRGVS